MKLQDCRPGLSISFRIPLAELIREEKEVVTKKVKKVVQALLSLHVGCWLTVIKLCVGWTIGRYSCMFNRGGDKEEVAYQSLEIVSSRVG